GVGGRRFKSSRADQKPLKNQPIMAGFFMIVFYAEKYRGIIGVKHLEAIHLAYHHQNLSECIHLFFLMQLKRSLDTVYLHR
ncbi:hypothetical protein, partial [Escherichia coli]|uniref:hypothetical protein n=1 Tax=Escherichia coli TaxID=562 RepID=UPI0005309BFC